MIMRLSNRTIVAAILSGLSTCMVHAQVQYATLDIRQYPGSPNIWAAPNRGAVVAEDDFFEQEGIAERLRQEDAMVVFSSRTGQGGITHRHYQQRHAGLEVEGAVMITHAQGGELLRSNGMVATLPTYDVPSVSAEEALYTVQNELGLLGPLVDGQDWEVTQNELVYAPRTWDTQGAPLEFRMCWRIGVLRYERYLSTVAYVDAYTGEVLRWEPGAMECSAGNALTLYHGWQGITTRWYNFLTNHYELRDECRGERIHTRIDNHVGNFNKFYKHSQCDDVEDGDNIWTAAEDRAAASLHWAAEMYWDYLDAKLGRNGVDGNGGVVKLVYHPTVLRVFQSGNTSNDADTVAPFNAKWESHFDEYHFGRGDGVSPWVSLDVVSHELTHGMIGATDPNRLTGGNETKALNESFADIFGIFCEWYTLPLHDPNRLPDFTIGEDVANGPLRSMSDPWNFNMPRAFQSAGWLFPPNDEPHHNSSVQTYCYYLLAFGSAGKPVEPGTSVCGIGIDAAAEIAYETIIDYSAAGATHFDIRDAAVLAASDLYGPGSFEAQQCNNAWAAVNVGTGSNFCNPVATDPQVIAMTSQINVYPNPANVAINVVININTRVLENSLSIWSSTGVKVGEMIVPNMLSPGSHSWVFDCGSLPTGLYYVLFSAKDFNLCKKVSIIR